MLVPVCDHRVQRPLPPLPATLCLPFPCPAGANDDRAQCHVVAPGFPEIAQVTIVKSGFY